MKKLFLLSILFLSVIVLSVSIGFCANEPQVFIRGIRPLGMGGAFVALADDQNAIFYNPAGLTQRVGGQFTLFELPLNISEDAFKFSSFFNDNKDKLEKFDTLSPIQQIDLLNKINGEVISYQPKLKFGLPNTCYITKTSLLSWGFGVFDQIELGFQFNRSLIIPNLSFWGNGDIIMAVPLAYRFDFIPLMPGKISAGAVLKYIQRGRISELNRSVLEFENFDPKLQWGKGFGFDLGALYQPTERWNIGLQITDFGGTNLSFEEVKSSKAGVEDKKAFTGMIPVQYNAGTAYVPEKIYYWPGRYINTADRIMFALDIRDFASSDEPVYEATLWKKIHMGAEFRFGPLSLRGGFNSGYPSIGAGVRIPYAGLKLDYAYWADELGRYAGQIPVWNHQINLALSWGDSKGRPYGISSSSEKDETSKKQKPNKQKTDTKKEAKEPYSVSTSTTTVVPEKK